MPAPRTRARRLGAGAATTALACALAGSTLAEPARAAADPAGDYRATGSTSVVSIRVTLPTAVPGVPNPVELSLLGSDGQALRTASEDVARTTSALAGGRLVEDGALASALSPLRRVLTATKAAPGPFTASAVDVPDNPLGLGVGVGEQVAVVRGAATESTGAITGAGMGSLRDLGLVDELEPLLDQLDAATATITSQTSALNGVLEAVPALPVVQVPNPLEPVLGGAETISTPKLSGATLSDAVSEVPARVAALRERLLDGALVELSSGRTSQTITPSAASTSSRSTNGVVDVDLVGGLVSVVASDSKASAVAGSGAAADATATLAKIAIADDFGTLLEAVASEKGLTAGLLDGSLGQALDPTVRPVVETVDAALGTLLDELGGLLADLGAGAQVLRQGTVEEQVSADGRTAEARALPALVRFGLPVAPQLVEIALGAAEATSQVSARSAMAPAPVAPQLPRTGAGELPAALGAAAIALAAVVARRRRTA